MLRTLSLCVAILNAPIAHAETADLSQRLWQVMEMDVLMPVLRDEALAEAESMSEALFQRGGTGQWIQLVGEIHDPARMRNLFDQGLEAALTSMDQTSIENALAFYEAPLGRRLIGLETSARVAIMDKATEEDARQSFDVASESGAPRAEQIVRLIDEADLIGPNVAGGLNAVIAFSRGFDEGGGYPMPMGENQILSDAWAQEAQLEQDTQNWLQAYLLMAYSPLSDEDLERYIDFAASAEGKALSGALFAGFDAIFRQTSYDLGLAAAGQLSGREL